MTDDQTRPNSVGNTRPGRAQDRTAPMQTHSDRAGLGSGAEPPDLGVRRRVPWGILGAVLAFSIVILVFGAGSGYFAGVEARSVLRATQQANFLQEQFDLGVADIEADRLQVARDRFEYILSVDPQFAGARDLLNLIQEGLNQPTASPSPTASPITLTPTPTLSLSSLDGLIEAGRDANSREDWDSAIEAVLALWARDPDYRADEVNSILYTALRSRGMQKLFRRDIEQGIYDLRLAARVATLDGTAQSWMRSGEFYSFANSFFGLDWFQAVVSFADLCAAGIWDSCYKYSVAAAEYGHLLVKDEMYCEAADQYSASLTTRDQAELYPTATYAFEACLTATAGTPTPTPTGTQGSVTPTLTPSATATPPGPTVTDTITTTASATAIAGPTDTPTLPASATSPTP